MKTFYRCSILCIICLGVGLSVVGMGTVAYMGSVVAARLKICTESYLRGQKRKLMLYIAESELSNIDLRVEPKQKKLIGYEAIPEEDREILTYWLVLRLQNNEDTLAQIRGELEVNQGGYNPLTEALF